MSGRSRSRIASSGSGGPPQSAKASKGVIWTTLKQQDAASRGQSVIMAENMTRSSRIRERIPGPPEEIPKTKGLPAYTLPERIASPGAQSQTFSQRGENEKLTDFLEQILKYRHRVRPCPDVDRRSEGFPMEFGSPRIAVPGTGRHMMLIMDMEIEAMEAAQSFLRTAIWARSLLKDMTIDVWEFLGSINYFKKYPGIIRDLVPYIMLLGTTNPAIKLIAVLVAAFKSDWLKAADSTRRRLPLQLIKDDYECMDWIKSAPAALDIWFSFHCPILFPVSRERMIGAGASMKALFEYYNQTHIRSRVGAYGPIRVNNGKPFWACDMGALESFASEGDRSLVHCRPVPMVSLTLEERLAAQLEGHLLWSKFGALCGDAVTAAVEWLRHEHDKGFSLEWHTTKLALHLVDRRPKQGADSSPLDSLSFDKDRIFYFIREISNICGLARKNNQAGESQDKSEDSFRRINFDNVVRSIPTNAEKLAFTNRHFSQVVKAVEDGSSLRIEARERHKVCVLPNSRARRRKENLRFSWGIPLRDFVFVHQGNVINDLKAGFVTSERARRCYIGSNSLPFSGIVKNIGTVGCWSVNGGLTFLKDGDGLLFEVALVPLAPCSELKHPEDSYLDATDMIHSRGNFFHPEFTIYSNRLPDLSDIRPLDPDEAAEEYPSFHSQSEWSFTELFVTPERTTENYDPELDFSPTSIDYEALVIDMVRNAEDRGHAALRQSVIDLSRQDVSICAFAAAFRRLRQRRIIVARNGGFQVRDVVGLQFYPRSSLIGPLLEKY